MARIIAAHDDIEAVICNNDEMALGAVEALKAAGYLVDGGVFIPVVGVDANEEAKLAIKEGTMYASVFNDARGQADAVEQRFGAFDGLCAAFAQHLGGGLDEVFQHRAVWKEVEALENHRHFAAHLA